MLRSLFLSIAFFFLFQCKSKRGSTERGEMTLSMLKWEQGNRFFVYLGFVRGSHLDFCFKIDVWWENDDVVFLMVMEEKQNKGSCLDVHLGLMGYGELRSSHIFMDRFALWWLVPMNEEGRTWVWLRREEDIWG